MCGYFISPLSWVPRLRIAKSFLCSFSAALTGLPVLLCEKDISVEYPADVDDENITEAGFLPVVPRESTRLASALALFEASRILNKVLEQLYPSAASYEIPLSKLRALADELDAWLKKIPRHLRLEFAQDKPSTGVTSSRSPLLVRSVCRLAKHLVIY